MLFTAGSTATAPYGTDPTSVKSCLSNPTTSRNGTAPAVGGHWNRIYRMMGCWSMLGQLKGISLCEPQKRGVRSRYGRWKKMSQPLIINGISYR